MGALAHARKKGSPTIFITCAPEAVGLVDVNVVINPVVGPEVVTGSTRMKAGTATKLVLNTLTTAAMIRVGKVHGNLMVDLRVGSDKLRDRAERIVMTVAGVSRRRAKALLARADGQAKIAIVMALAGLDAKEARERLDACDGFVREAVGDGKSLSE